MFVALCNVQERTLSLKHQVLKTSLVDVRTVGMAGIKEATVLICFEMNGVKMEMMGLAIIEEGSMRGMEKAFL